MEETHLILRPAFPGWVLAALAAAVVLVALWAYRRTSRPITPGLKASSW